MKFLFVFLGFYMLGLSCIACSDTDECNASPTTTISASNNHQKDDHSIEFCTPFCTCSCCTASTFCSAVTRTPMMKPLVISEKHPLFNVAFDTEVHHSIWQPPKIAA